VHLSADKNVCRTTEKRGLNRISWNLLYTDSAVYLFSYIIGLLGSGGTLTLALYDYETLETLLLKLGNIYDERECTSGMGAVLFFIAFVFFRSHAFADLIVNCDIYYAACSLAPYIVCSLDTSFAELCFYDCD